MFFGQDNSFSTNRSTSYALLDAYFEMNLPQPILSVKLHKNTPEKLYKELGRFLFTLGCLTPSFFNDDSLFELLEKQGVAKEELPDYAVAMNIDYEKENQMLDTYRRESNVPLTYKTFQNATELIFKVSSGDYSILLLDILMLGINGMQSAYEIRAFDAGVKIVFLTSSPEFAVESYAVNAYGYILKPVSKDKLFSMLDAVIAEEQIPMETLKKRRNMYGLHRRISRISPPTVIVRTTSSI